MAELDISDSKGSNTAARNKKARRPRTAVRKRPRATAKKNPVALATSEPTAARAAKLALNLVEFEKTTFSSATALMRSLNDRSEKAIRHAIASSKWMPKEGQKLVEEWQRTLRHSLKDFTKSVDKSFDLMSKSLARLQAETARKDE